MAKEQQLSQNLSGENPTIRKQFGARVRQLREDVKVSQEAFADHAGMARSYMSRIERGLGIPSLVAVDQLAKALGVTTVDLFKGGKFAKASKAPDDVVPFASRPASGLRFRTDVAKRQSL